MKITVTGALGHIGSFLIRDLAFHFPNSEILIIDNLLTQRFSSLFNLPSTGKYHFIEGDVNKLNLSEIINGSHVVIHLAAITDAAGSYEKAEEVESNNYNATINLANACLNTNARLIMLSSTSVYGSQNKIVDEDCSAEELQPQSPYALTKLREEDFLKELGTKSALKSVICRFGTIFGASPGIRFHTAVNKFCWQAVMGQAISVWSTAYDQKRPYLDLYDASRAIRHIINNDLFYGTTYNILTHNLTVREVVDSIKKYIPNIKISFVDSKIMNQLSYEVSAELFKSTGFNFCGDINRAIGETIALLKHANND
jgi:UDP-glucose 4-epimerase